MQPPWTVVLLLPLSSRLRTGGFEDHTQAQVVDVHRDKKVNIASLVGANRDFILNDVRHTSKLLFATMADVLNHSQTIVIGNKEPRFRGSVGAATRRSIPEDFIEVIEGGSRNGKCQGVYR
jgi:hypothetical protein